jgi:hypothetical protein
MNIETLFYQLPLWSVYIITVVIVLISVVGGFFLGSYIRRRGKSKQEAPIGAVVGALLGLLAFILAFTFGMTASRFEARKQLLLDEVNAIGTAFLRADFLPEPQRAETKKLLRKYVDIRLKGTQQYKNLPQALVDSEALHDQLWSQVATLSQQTNDKILIGLYIQSLNEVIDLHSKRLTVGTQYRIPGSIWLALYFVTVMAMVAVGYHFGLAGGGSFLVSLLLSVAFSTVILLIADIDRAREGLLKVSQQPMLELQQKLNTSAK